MITCKPSAATWAIGRCIAGGVVLVLLFPVLGRGVEQTESIRNDGTRTEAEVNSLRQQCSSCHSEDEVMRYTIQTIPTQSDDAIEISDPFEATADQPWLQRRQIIIGSRLGSTKPIAQVEQIIRWSRGKPNREASVNRRWMNNTNVMTQIVTHLTNLPEPDRKYQRYLTLAHLHNNPVITERDLRLCRAALSKTVNSMSDQTAISSPTPIDPDKTVLNIDLRNYGWQDFGTWEAVVEAYPYGIKPQSNSESLKLYEQIELLYGAANFDGITSIRADWFVANATRPPLYPILADIPETFNQLMTRLGVDPETNFQKGVLQRAGVSESGVSSQNRLVEFHPANEKGLLWISYHFDRDSKQSNLALFPLGPSFEGNPFSDEAFQHSGATVMFELPNGLLAYMLVDASGQRLDTVPVSMLWDILATSGSPAIVNGLSCIGCHQHGPIEVSDFVRGVTAVNSPNARQKVTEIFPPQADMDQAVATAKQRFMQHLWTATSEALEMQPNERNALFQVQEPIRYVASLYGNNMDLQSVACELDLETPEVLLNHVLTLPMAELGLGPLATERGSVTRDYWESRKSTTSVFQEAISYLKLGTAITN